MRKILLLTSVLCAFCLPSFDVSAQIVKLTPLTTFGTNGDGTLRPGDVDYLNNNGQLQRGLAWNPVTGHLILVCRTNAASPTLSRVLVLDAATGTNISQMDLESLALGGNPSFYVNLVGVADDGAIYVVNLSNTQVPAQIRLYRWDNEGAAQTLPWYSETTTIVQPDVNRRWGDTLAVRGAGTNTEVLIASRGTNLILLRPTDSSMGSFYDTTITTTLPAGALGYGLTFGSGNTFWGTAGANTGGPLYYCSYDANAGAATVLQTWYPTNVSGLMTPITYFSNSNWLAGIDTRAGADFVRIYSVTNPAFAPVNQDRATWVGSNADNNTFSGSVAITTNNLLYALDGDNGIMAFTLSSVASNTLPPSITLPPQGRLVQVGSNVLFTAAADGASPLGYQWYYSTNNAATNAISGATEISFTVTNAQITNSGNYIFVATNSFGAATSSVATLTVISNSVDFLAYEGFDYPVGSALTGQTPPGAPFAWLLNSGTSGVITNDNLIITGLAPATGKAYTWGNSASSMRLPIGTNVSGTLYFAFAYRLDNLGTAPAAPSETTAGFTFGTGTSFASKINVSTNLNNTWQLGLYKAGGTTIGSVATNIFNVGDTVFIVSRYSFHSGSGSDDTCDLWLNPDPSTFGADTPPTPTIANVGATGGTDLAQLDRFFFRRSNGWPLRTTADELRIGYSWAQVTPQAPPTLTAIQSATNVVISWPSFYGSDYILEGTTNIVGGTWISVTNAVSVSGSNNVVTVSAKGSRYFRLLK